MKRKVFGLVLIIMAVGIWFYQRWTPDINKEVLEKTEISEVKRKTKNKVDLDSQKDLRNFEKEEEIRKLKEINPDVVGIIEIPGTKIIGPILQTDNNEFYLNHNIYKEYDVNGSIYLDYECDSPEKGDHTIIYGHNMKNRKMFSDIALFKEENFFKEHNTIKIYMPQKVLEYEIIAGYIINLQDENAFFPFHEYTSWNDEIDGKKYYESILPLSVVKKDVEVSPKDSFISLSTCTYEHNNARFILLGRKL
ncbi:MAG: class B sortase [Tissierellia bacterium]|nr:class B sortase [Tissierellia bacterium]